MGSHGAHDRRGQRTGTWHRKGAGNRQAVGRGSMGAPAVTMPSGAPSPFTPVAAAAAAAAGSAGPQTPGAHFGQGYPPLLAQASVPGLVLREAVPGLAAAAAAVVVGPLPGRGGSGVQPGPNAQGGAAGTCSADSIAYVEEMIEKEVALIAPRRNRLRQCVEDALVGSKALQGCRVEVVGSTSWGGDVPQSDLDVVLSTPERNSAEGRRAVELLEHLRGSLEAQDEKERAWKKLEILDTARVPILRLHDGQGLCCEVSVDSPASLKHRALLKEAVAGRPEACTLIRLVKYWLRRKGLPMAAEGGIASLAWAVTALRLAEEHPPGTPVEKLLVYYFSKMQQLGEMSLAVRQLPQGTQFIWKPRTGPSAWAQEWMQLLLVDDPTQPEPPQAGVDGFQQATSCLSLTPKSIPAALAVLYVAELRLAWKAIRDSRWDELWKKATPEVRMALPAVIDLKGGKAPLHICLKEGVVIVGQLQEVRRCPSVQQEVLQRRDQSSELLLQPCSLEKDGGGSGSMTMVKSREGAMLSCQPCHWVCALPTWNTKVVPGDGLARLSEVMALVEAPASSWNAGSVTMQRGWYIAAMPASRLRGTFFQPVAGPVAFPLWPVWPSGNAELFGGSAEAFGNNSSVGCVALYSAGASAGAGAGVNRGRWQSRPWSALDGQDSGLHGSQQAKGKGKSFGAKSAGKGSGGGVDGIGRGARPAPQSATDKAHSDDSTRASDSDVDSQKNEARQLKQPLVAGVLPPGMVNRNDGSSGSTGSSNLAASARPAATDSTDDARTAVVAAGTGYSDVGSSDGYGSEGRGCGSESQSVVAGAAGGAEEAADDAAVAAGTGARERAAAPAAASVAAGGRAAKDDEALSGLPPARTRGIVPVTRVGGGKGAVSHSVFEERGPVLQVGKARSRGQWSNFLALNVDAPRSPHVLPSVG